MPGAHHSFNATPPESHELLPVANQMVDSPKKILRGLDKARVSLEKYTSKANTVSPANPGFAVAHLASPLAARGDATRILVAPNEVCDKHGTGVLIQRIFGDGMGIHCIRSHDHYGGSQTFGDTSILNPPPRDRIEAITAAANLVRGIKITDIFAIPFFPADYWSAWALTVTTEAPLGVYVMDDQFLERRNVPEKLFRETMAAASIRFAISPQMRDAYEAAIGLKFYVLPPLADHALLRTQPSPPPPTQAGAPRGVLVGSVWNPAWLSNLCDTVRETGLPIDWFGNYNHDFHKTSVEELATSGIHVKGMLPERDLLKYLDSYAFALIPLGPGEESDEWSYISRYSLQTRVAFLSACSGIPMLVLSGVNSANGDFVTRFGLGASSSYRAADLSDTLSRLCTQDEQIRIRKNAATLAPVLSADGIGDWIWRSLRICEPADQRFETAFRRGQNNFTPWIEPALPPEIPWYFSETVEAVRRISKTLPHPDCVFDVGASSGVWSHYVRRFAFPDATYHLFEPLLDRHLAAGTYFKDVNPDFTFHKCALSDSSGSVTFKVSNDLYGSSLLDVEDGRTYEAVTVPTLTLDEFCSREGTVAFERAFLKLDVQGAEHLVLKGATGSLKNVAYALLELSLTPISPDSLSLLEMYNLMDQLGFRPCEMAGGWRCPVDGTLIQQDVLFIKKDCASSNPSA